MCGGGVAVFGLRADAEEGRGCECEHRGIGVCGSSLRGSTRSPRISSSLSRAFGLAVRSVDPKSLWSEALVEHRFGAFSFFACLERREKSERMVRPGFCLMRIVMMRMSIAVIPVIGIPVILVLCVTRC